jgi:hypothetical protein
MKFSIGINTYKNTNELENRQLLCIQALQKLSNKFDNVSLFNVQYEDENIEIDNFTKLQSLTKNSHDILEDYFNHHGLRELYVKEFETHMDSIKEKRIPAVKHIIDALAETDCTHIIFLNDDIVASDRMIKQIQENSDYDCYPMSKLHLFDFDSLDGDFKPESYSVHGFDGFCFRKDWWINNRNNFHEQLIGKPYWDTHFFALCQLLGRTFTLNKLPPVIFHPEHSSTSCTDIDILAKYNEDIFNRDINCKQLWYNYVYNVLLKRPEVNGIKWYKPFPNEKELESNMFKGYICKGVKPFKEIDIILKQPSREKEFDAFLPCAPKDMIKLKYMLRGLIKNAKGLKSIHICTPKSIPEFEVDFPIYYHLDREVLPNIDPLRWKFRPNWCFQQFLKLFQEVTTTDYYLTVDIDTTLNRPMTFFDGDNPIWYEGWRQNHLPYFLFNKYMLELDKVADHTFICDMNFFNKTIINEMLRKYDMTVEEFAEKSFDITSASCHIAEPEIYGNFVMKNYPDLYKIKKAKQFHTGKDHSNNPNAVPWTEKEIIELLKDKEDYDMVQMHSWCAGFEDHWK